jgi:hypothetical protein
MVVENLKKEERDNLWSHLVGNEVSLDRQCWDKPGTMQINRKELYRLYRLYRASPLPHSVMRRAEAQVTWRCFYLWRT